MFSSYSSFFTSGLLSEPCCSSSTSRSHSPALIGPRRGSLPNDTPPSLQGTSHKIQSSDESSAFYFTLQPRRDSAALRSFLSLDLAESQSIRSASIRRRNSTVTKSTLSSRNRMLLSSPPFNAPRGPYVAISSPLRPSIRRASRDLSRPLPSPKPVPSTTLPDVPLATTDLPPVLPPIRSSNRFSFGLSVLQATTTPSPGRVPTPPTPSRVATPPPPSSPVSSYHTPSKSLYDNSIISITSDERRISREDALASLEGRAENAHRDFMDMSDDEDDHLQLATTIAIEEDEEAFIASCSPHKASPKPRRARHQKSAKESWFPLASFIDLKDDDFSSWNWRNFIEVGGAS